MTDAHYQLGILYQDDGETAKAIRELETAAQLRPDFKAAHYRLSMLYRAQGQEERARDELQIVRSLAKD